MDKKQIELNVYLTESQHAQMQELRHLGINMSAVARVALNKYQNADLSQEVGQEGKKLKRVQIYLDSKANELLCEISGKQQQIRSEVLRRLLAKYLREHGALLKQLL